MTADAAIRLYLYAGLKERVPDCPEEIPIASGTTVADLLARLGIPPEKIHLVFVDGKKSDLQRALKGGERVGVFPPVGGG